MKGINHWNFRPYCEMYKTERGNLPYICRIEPGTGKFTVDIIDNGFADSEHILHYKIRGTENFKEIDMGLESSVSVENLDDLTDYEVFVSRKNSHANSSVRLVRTGYVPGKVVNYLHPDDTEYSFSGRYLCSPSLVRLENGRLLASMDLFAPNSPQNLTIIYYSDDNGDSWHYLTELFPCFWGKLFLHKGKLYMLAVSDEYGDLLIGRSDDGGQNWAMPTVLFRGSSSCIECGLHRAPMRIEIFNGRIWTDIQYGTWAKKIMTDAVISAPIDCDLLDASNWSCTEFWNHQIHAESGGEHIDGIAGGIEGNVITAPDGTLYDILRYADKKALFLKINPDEPEQMMTFEGIFDFPSTASKFSIVYDSISGLYYSLVSYALDEPKTIRNLLSLICSPDLKNWSLVKHVIDFRDSSPKEVAFQYVDFMICGDDILFLSRTAFNNAHNYHDSNYSTFHKIKDFRNLKLS